MTVSLCRFCEIRFSNNLFNMNSLINEAVALWRKKLEENSEVVV